jgi:hypothetical protein
MIESRKMRSVKYAARMGDTRNAYKIWFQNLKGRDHSEDVGADDRMILK